jgi:hypothetical protein
MVRSDCCRHNVGLHICRRHTGLEEHDLPGRENPLKFVKLGKSNDWIGLP